MAWHPKLVVRFNKGGSILSPTSSVGYVFQGGLALCMASALITLAVKAEPFVLLGLAIPGVFLRDTWAWFASTREERASFLDEIECLRSFGWGPSPEQIFGADWGWWEVAGLLVCLTVSIALMFFGYPIFLVAAMFSTAFLICALLDRLRAGKDKSAA